MTRASAFPPLALVSALALAACSSPAPEPSFQDHRAEQHNRAGLEAMRRGDVAAAELQFARALEIARSFDDTPREVDALLNQGTVLETRGDEAGALGRYDAADAVLSEAAARLGAERDWYPRGALAADLNRSRVLARLGRVDEADQAVERAARVAEALGTRSDRAAVQKQRALLLGARGLPDQAIAPAAEASRLYGAVDRDRASIAGGADARILLGGFLLATGDGRSAIEEFKQAERMAKEISDRTLIALALDGAGRALETLGHVEDARLHLRAAFDVNVRIPHLGRARANLAALERMAAPDDDAALREVDELRGILESSSTGSTGSTGR